MVDKRTRRSQSFKDRLRQPPRSQPDSTRDALPRSFSCDAIPQPNFDFPKGDPAFNDLWELLCSVHVSASAMNSPLAPTLRHIMLKFDHLASNTTIAMMMMLKYQLPPYILTPKSFPVDSPFEPSIISDANSASSLFADDDVQFSQIISQLDALSTTLSSVEPQWHEWNHSLTAQVDSISSFYEQLFSSP